MNIELIILIGAAVVAIGVFLWEIFRRSPEERKAYLIDFIVGLVVAAEDEIGAGHVQEKLEAVEAMFKEKAPFIMKVLLKLSGSENLTELIETALSKVKENFSNKQ